MMSEENVIDLNIEDIPAMPFIVGRVMSLLADPDVSVKKISTVISDDPAIMSKILRVSNSPIFGCSKTISSLREAIVIMGLNAIKSIVITYSTKRVFKRKGLLAQLLWEHSVGAAIASNLIARKTKSARPDDAFIGGLLHDIGKDIMNLVDPDKYEEVMKTTYNNNLDFIGVETEMFGFSHLEAGITAIEKWNLPTSLGIVARYHHDNEEAQDLFREDKSFLSVVSLGNLFCIKSGIGRKDPKKGLNLSQSPPAKDLKIDDEKILQLREEFEELYEQEKNLFL